MPSRLDVEVDAQGVGVLTFSNPSRRHALDDALVEALEAAVSRPGAARALVLRSPRPGPFCSGFDLTALKARQAGQPPPDLGLSRLMAALAACPLPTVAVVEGPAIGAGCELALCCDFRVGGLEASFSMPPARLGILYGAQGLQRLAAKLGLQQTRWLFLTARPVSGAQALARGFLDVLDDSQPEAAALALARELAALSPSSLAGTKEALQLLALGPRAAGWADWEARQAASFDGPEAAEGLAAVLERRPPRFFKPG